jgi:repressor LexA
MSLFSERLKALRLEKNLSLRQLSKLTGISSSAIHSYEVESRNPGKEALEAFSDVFNVDIDYIVGKSDIPNQATVDAGGRLSDLYFTTATLPSNVRPITSKKFPMLGKIACGQPLYADQEFETFVEASSEIKADFCLTAQGDSMIGAGIHDGDVVFIKDQPIVDNGQVAAVIIDDEATLKRWYYYPDKQKLVLNPENPKYEPLVYVGEELNTVKCLGRAVYYMGRIV